MISSSQQPPSDPNIPQVLLFGHSGAGKSALLGALFQAGEKQGDILLGELLDPSGRLETLRDAVYRSADLEPTHTEVTSFTVRLRPWRIDGQLVTDSCSFVLHDCSGKAAERLFRHPDSLQDPNTRAPAARAVIDADAIVLLVNAAADDDELNHAFGQFEAFLSVVGKGKANAREVGGFPVFLVLTQCDRLAQPTDTRSVWEARIHEQAERSWEKFTAFLKDAAHEDDLPQFFLPFGSIELSVETVAIRWPRLTDTPGQPTTPYRVADLFRNCFSAARLHRARVHASNRRLRWTVRSALTVAAALVIGSILLALFQPPDSDTELADQIVGYELREPSAAVRLADVNIERNKHILERFRNDPGFSSLPGDLQEFVESRLKEINDYEQYRGKLAAAMAPADCRSLEELARVDSALKNELAPPLGYSWEETPAALLRDKWLADVNAIRRAESSFLAHYLDLSRRGLALTLTPSFAGSWRSDVSALIAEGSRPPANLSDPLPGSPSLAQPQGQAVTNRAPYEFDGVYQARQDWAATGDRLTHLRDLADALGLTEGPDRPDPVLVLPEPGPGINPVTLPTARWTALIRQYSEAWDDFRGWNLKNFPDPGRSALAEQLNRSIRVGVKYVQDLIRSRIGPGREFPDTAEGWHSLAILLTDSTTPFPEWGRLLHLELRLIHSSEPNPVLVLAEFLRKNAFELEIRDLELAVPVDLSLDRVIPGGPFSLTSIRKDGASSTVRLSPVGDGVREGSTTKYHLMVEGSGKLHYTPGEGLRAELPVRSGKQEFKLVWEPAGSRVYPFDLFDHEPRLVRSAGPSEAAFGVKVTLGAATSWPQLPLLFPAALK